MAEDQHVDAIVAGGGVAGCAAAAALSSAGLSVLVVEPGQRAERRLAGELLHPPGVRGLDALGFSLPLQASAPVLGFCVFHDTAVGRSPTVLTYPGKDGDGVAIEHGALRDSLATQLRTRPGVTVMAPARVVDLDLADPERPVAVVRRDGETSRIRAKFIVAADGAASPIRAKAGIDHRRRPLSSLLGFTVDRALLPMPGYGHLFLGAPRPVFAYAVDADRARIMFDLALEKGEQRLHDFADALAALPAPLRLALERAGPDAGLGNISHDVCADPIVRGRILLMGDAGGSCHPLTATGMTMAVSDALILQEALRNCPHEPHRALALYGRRRRAVQRTRRLLASALYETCSAPDPGALLMRRGLERYWRQDARARAASLALLAMIDVRLGSALREMSKVALNGAAAMAVPGHPRLSSALLPLRQPRTLIGAAGLIARHMQAALWAR